MDASGQETRMMGLPEGWKSFEIGLAVQRQYWRVTDRHIQTDTRRQQRPRLRIASRGY